MASVRVAGVCYFKIDAIQFTMRGSGKVNVTSIKRTRIVNLDRTISFKEEPVAGDMELELECTPGFPVQSLNLITNGVIQMDAANGTTYTLQSGFQEDDLQVDTDEGKVKAKFAGNLIEAPSI